MYKINLFQYKFQFHYVFNVNSGHQGSPYFFSTFYGFRRFIIMLTRALHWALS
jgi:hypothetical protein